MTRISDLNSIINTNDRLKRASDEYTASKALMEAQAIVLELDTSGKVSEYNYVKNKMLCPNLEGYNVHYEDADFLNFSKLYDETMQKKNVNSNDVTVMNFEEANQMEDDIEVLDTETTVTRKKA